LTRAPSPLVPSFVRPLPAGIDALSIRFRLGADARFLPRFSVAVSLSGGSGWSWPFPRGCVGPVQLPACRLPPELVRSSTLGQSYLFAVLAFPDRSSAHLHHALVLPPRQFQRSRVSFPLHLDVFQPVCYPPLLLLRPMPCLLQFKACQVSLPHAAFARNPCSLGMFASPLSNLRHFCCQLLPKVALGLRRRRGYHNFILMGRR
jgi:hypothetical protein